MKLNKPKTLLLCTCLLLFSGSLFAESSMPSKLGNRQSVKTDKSGARDLNSSTPFFLKFKIAEPRLTTFTNLNVGIGMLYFSGVKGNLETDIPGIINNVKVEKPLPGHITYNRTPLVEATIGLDVFNWWKIGLSMQHQGRVKISTQPSLLFSNYNINARTPTVLNLDLNLNAVMFKTFLMFPYTLVWKNMFTEPYLGLAVGPGWQTWSAITQKLGILIVPFKQKISANCVFTVDLGFKLRKAVDNYILAFTFGCKYNQWGQARSMGRLSDQYTSPVVGFPGLQRPGLSNPLRIKTVYQFAPYIGAQLSF